MHKIAFEGLSSVELLEMADALMLSGNYQAAYSLYCTGCEQVADPVLRRRFQVRHGLLTPATADSKALLEVTRQVDGLALGFVGAGLATWRKTLPFYDDQRFAALARKHALLLPMPNWHWNLSTVVWALREAAKAEGDFMELGVFRGHTTLFAAEYLEFQRWPQRWWLYDTFEGIPADQLNPGWEKVNADLYGGTYSYEEVAGRFAAFPNIEVVKGRVPEILHERCPEKVAFLHLDLNSAVAEVAALEFLFDRLSPGGVIVLDDYGWASARAQYDAEKAWFEARGVGVLMLPTGQGVVMKR